MEKRTPLYDAHVKAGGKIVPFGGFLMPVQYAAGVIKEHMAVREAAGLFDVSHMGEILCKGPGALAYLNRLLTNDFTNMVDGQARYTIMCNEEGGIVDDLIVYKKAENDYFIVVNAGTTDKDFAHMQKYLTDGAELVNASADWGQIALQGPKAMEILRKVADESCIPQKYYHAVFDGKVRDIPCIISKTGYTGEDGVELYCAADRVEALWNLLLEAGESEGLIPCGLGARDTLRLEAAMPLYGHEMDDVITPLETGLSFAVKMQKDDFIGKSALVAKGEPKRMRVGMKVSGRGIIREHSDVFLGDRKIGETTSGTHCPFLGYPIAMALVEAGSVSVGDTVEADVRGRRVAAEIVPLPFYKRAK